MRSISITFHEGVSPEKRKAVLKKINKWKVVKEAGQLMPESKNAGIQRMAYAYLEDVAEIEDVSKKLNEIPEIDSASEPPERQLVNN